MKMLRLIIFSLLILFTSCNEEQKETAGKKKSDEKIESENSDIETITGFHNGDNCFEYYGLGGQGYMHMDIVGEDITGVLYETDEDYGNFTLEFNGIMQGDSIVVLLHDFPEDVETVWELRIGSDGQIRIFGLPSNPGLLDITPIDCENLPDTEMYFTAQEIALKKEAEYAEYQEGGSLCFYKYHNTPGGRTTVAEYLKISFDEEGENINGLGTGYLEGEGEWKMEFKGTPANDTTFRIEASYEHDLNNITKFKTTEIWYIDQEQTRITIKKISSNEFRQPGITPFHRIDCMNMESWAKKKMWGE